MRWTLLLATIALSAGTARAERDFCADRPGKGTPSCTLDPGTLQLETSFVDHADTREADDVEGETLIGDSLLRWGVADHAEFRLGWTPYGIDRDRDRATGAVTHRHRVGDVTLGIRRNLANPDGDGVSFAVQPFVSLPVGRRPIGGGTWGVGLLAPLVVSIDEHWSLNLDPEVDAALDEDGHRRHLAWSTVLDLTRKVGEDWQVTAEGFVQRDRDPRDDALLATADLAIARQFGDDGQIDFAVYRGLTRDSPRYELVVGFARRFR